MFMSMGLNFICNELLYKKNLQIPFIELEVNKNF